MSASAASTDRSWEGLARHAARVETRGEDTAATRQILCFELDGASYAIPVDCVQEIVRMRTIAPVPRVPADVCGVISLRGLIVQVVDLRSRLGVSTPAPTRSSRIIVVRTGEGRVSGLLVDAVTEVLRVREDALVPAPGGDADRIDSLCSRGDEFVSLVDLESALRFGDDC